MKTKLKKETIFPGVRPGVFMASFFVSTLIIVGTLIITSAASTASAADPAEDPNLPLTPTASASSAMQAVNPAITIRSANPAASAAGAAASAPSTAVAATAAAGPVPVAPTTATEVTDADYKSYSYALKNVDGVQFDKSLNLLPVPKFWRPADVSSKKITKLTNEARDQFVDLTVSPEGRYEVVTYNKTNENANVTIFRNRKPESYTVIGKKGQYSATPAFCEMLRVQTKSATFAELKERAVTCKTFFERPPVDKAADDAMKEMRQELFAAHRSNILLLKSSAAKPLADAKVKIEEDSRIMNAIRILRDNKLKDPMISVKPRAILTASGSPEEAEDRAVLSELGEACGSLWKDAGGAAVTKTAAPATTPQGGGVTK